VSSDCQISWCSPVDKLCHGNMFLTFTICCSPSAAVCVPIRLMAQNTASCPSGELEVTITTTAVNSLSEMNLISRDSRGRTFTSRSVAKNI